MEGGEKKKGERLVEFVDFGDSPLKGLIIAVSAETVARCCDVCTHDEVANQG